LGCHAALDAASSLCFPGFVLEFIPVKIGTGMTNIVKGFTKQRWNPGEKEDLSIHSQLKPLTYQKKKAVSSKKRRPF